MATAGVTVRVDAEMTRLGRGSIAVGAWLTKHAGRRWAGWFARAMLALLLRTPVEWLVRARVRRA